MIILENTKEYKDTKLEIPVGIGVVQTESVKNFYNTSDADATSADIVKDKTAYGKYGKLTGTLDLENEKEISYQKGYETGKTDGYAEGIDVGIIDGRNQIIEEQSDANITASDVTKGKIGYGANNKKIVGTLEAITNIDVAENGIVFHDWTMDILQSYYDFQHVTNMDGIFTNCPYFTTMNGIIDATSIENFGNIFVDCPVIANIDIVNISKSINIAPYKLLMPNSVKNVLNGLLPVEDSPIISLGSNLNKVTNDDLALAANKGWLITGYNLIGNFNVDLNNQWELSTTIPNPDSEEYDGVYQSFSNYNVNGGQAQMMIEIEGYVNFSIFIRSYGEPNYDYIWVGQLDKVPTSDNNAYATTRSKPNANTSIEGYTEVKFENMDAGKHTIYIVYKKDAGGNKNDDRGYVLIPKNQ